MNLKKRNEMDPKFQWDYTHMFESKEAWEKAFREAQELIGKVQGVAGTLGQSARR